MSVCQKLLFVFLFIAAIFLFLPKVAFAQVVINEIMANPVNEDTGEFMELYNQGLEPVDVANWKMVDVGDTNDYLIDFTGSNDWGSPGTTIPVGGFALIVDPEYTGEYNIYLVNYADPEKVVMLTNGQDTTLGNGLGNGGDTVTIDNNAGYINSVTWSSDSGENFSWERVETTWVISGDPAGSTPGKTNSQGIPTPTPTPTPVPTNTPTPGPTNTPTPTPKPPTPTPTKKPTPALTPTPTSTPTPTGGILGEEATLPSTMVPSSTATLAAQTSQGNLRNLLPKIFIGTGILLLVGSAVPFILPKLKKGGILKKDEEVE